MFTRVVLSGSELKDLFRGKMIYKDIRTGPLEISLKDMNLANMRDMLEEVIDEKFPIQTMKSVVPLTRDDD